MVRFLRVGIRNDSDLVIRSVRVVLESLSPLKEGAMLAPSPEHRWPLEHALTVMGHEDDKSGRVDVSPGDLPAAYFDVVAHITQVDWKDNPSKYIQFQYASGHRMDLLKTAHWIVGLRVEGGGAYSRARFLIDGTGADFVMTPYELE